MELWRSSSKKTAFHRPRKMKRKLHKSRGILSSSQTTSFPAGNAAAKRSKRSQLPCANSASSMTWWDAKSKPKSRTLKKLSASLNINRTRSTTLRKKSTRSRTVLWTPRLRWMRAKKPQNSKWWSSANTSIWSSAFNKTSSPWRSRSMIDRSPMLQNSQS